MGEEDLNESYGEDIKPLPKESTVPTEPIEFDGTTVLCRVCGDKASGFHYGVHSCEGCKGFFRRSIQQKIQYRPCTKNQQCSILRINRNRCQYCRLKKCIAVGMSRDAVRFGRVPKREKAKILAAMQKNNASSQEKALNAAIEDDFKLMTTIIMAHEDTSEFTSDKVASFVEQARSHPVYSQCSPHGACPLNPAPHILDNDSLPGLESAKEFSKRFAPAIKGVVEFAKRIPGFQLLVTDDQVTLLKAGVFEVLLVRLAGMFDSQTNSLICLNGQVLRRDSLHHTSNARFLLDSMFDFAERMNALHLSDSEIALFCAVVILSPDRPGLRNGDLVSKMWQKITGFLQKSIAKSHPDNPGVFSELMKKIPDLRTLNTLHSEKLLAYKTEEPTIVNEMAVTGSIDVITSSSITNENSAYAAISHDIWGNYSLLTNQPPLIIHDEDMRCNSPPEVNSSSSSGSSGSDEWSTVDKEEQDLDGSPESVNGHCIDDAKSPPRTSSFSNHNGYANEESWVADSNQSVLAYQQHMMKRASENNVSPEHNSNSSDEGYYVDSPTKNLVYPKLHRVDSPTDSGIESGKEHGPSPPTIPNCSSPPSAVDEKMKDEQQRLSIQDKQDHIEDMPVLKRALQAPPLVNTNMLMDEAYRHHKKFRAARREAESPSSPTQMSLASTHSTLVRTLEQAPRYLSEQQLKRTDLIHNIIMQNETLPNHKSPPLPQHHQNSSQIPSQSHHVEALPTTCSSYSFSSVPNQTSPPPPQSSLTTSGVQQHKNLLLCANGYYVQQGGNVQSASIYSSSSTPALWPYSPQHTSPATTVSSATSPPLHVTQFEHPHIQQSSPVSFCSSPPVVNSSRAGSPRLSYHRSRSPATSTSLVMNGGVGHSPVHSTVCGSERAYHSEPSLKSFAESQPLNLSKKLFSPALVKIES